MDQGTWEDWGPTYLPCISTHPSSGAGFGPVPRAVCGASASMRRSAGASGTTWDVKGRRKWLDVVVEDVVGRHGTR